MLTLLELAELVKGFVIGEPNVNISGVSGLDDAKPGDITLLAALRALDGIEKS